MNRRHFLASSWLLPPAVKAATTTPPPPRQTAFRVAFLTDIHLKQDVVAEAGFVKALRHLNRLSPKPDFIINGGDAIFDANDRPKEEVAAQFALFQRLLNKETNIPVRHVIGNHDIFGWFHKAKDYKTDSLYGKKWFLQAFNLSQPYYTFEQGAWKFIVLDSILYKSEGYIAQLDLAQVEWLLKILKETPPSQPVCVVSHIPIVAMCSAFFLNKNEPNGDLIIRRNQMHTDAMKLINVFKQYKNVKLCLSGHSHMSDEVRFMDVTYMCNGAVCGNWWKGAFQGFAPAFAVIDFFDDGSFERQMIDY